MHICNCAAHQKRQINRQMACICSIAYNEQVGKSWECKYC